MSGKKKKKKGEKKAKQKNTAAIDDRFKKALAIQPPDENPYKMDNENKIDRFRSPWRTDRRTIKTQSRQKRRDSRPRRPKKSFF